MCIMYNIIYFTIRFVLILALHFLGRLYDLYIYTWLNEWH